MRLKQDQQPAVEGVQGLQRGRDLVGVMGEVVDDGDVAGRSDHFHPATDAGESLQRLDRLGRRHAQRPGRAQRRQRVGDIVRAGHVQNHVVFAPALDQPEPHACRQRLKIMGGQVGLLFAQAEGDRLAFRQGLGQGRRLGVVQVQHGRRRPRGEATEQVAQFLHRLVVQRDVGHHRHRRIVAGDGAVAFVHLRHEQVGAADQGAGERMIRIGEVLHHRAVHHGRLAACLM